jgi:hypothetical protein
MRMIMKQHLVFVLCVVGCTACPKTLPPEPPYVTFPPYEDAGVDGDSQAVSADCRVACESLARVGCPESAPGGATCGVVCTRAAAEGIPLNTVCVAAASTPDGIRACGVRCLGR